MIEVSSSQCHRDAFARAHAERGQALRSLIRLLFKGYSVPLRFRPMTGALTEPSR